MTTYDSELVMHLWEVFPESFNVTKTTRDYEIVNGRFGVEYVPAKDSTEILAESILGTASAYALRGLEAGLKYIDEFKPAKVQQREIKAFLR